MRFIPDIEVNLKENDLLKTGFYANVLKDIIKQSRGESLNIGLVGEWGSGKSSIIRTLQKEFQAKPEDGYGIVIYDAWKFSNDSFRRMFLITLKEQLGLKETADFRSFYETQSQDLRVKQRISVLWVILAFIGMATVYWLLPVTNSEFKTILKTGAVCTFMSVVINFLSKTLVDLKVSSSRPLLFAAEQFEACYNELISESLGTGLKRRRWFEKPKSIKQKIIIVIDNLDRCHKEMAYELLTVLKTFLGNHKNVIFIIPYDENGLQEHFKAKAGDTSPEAGGFLRKLFNVLIRIKPLKNQCALFVFPAFACDEVHGK